MLAAHANPRLASVGREALARAARRVPASAQAMAATALVTLKD
jgi:hypothetical protein